MKQYIARRLLLMIPLIFGVVSIVFVVLNILPGDVAASIATQGEEEPDPAQIEAIRTALGLDRPLHQQYWDWLSGAARLDFGDSLVTGQSVMDDVRRRLPVTIQLGIMSLIIAWAIALPVGILSAVRQDSWMDYVGRSFAILGLAMPTFWVGILIILMLSRYFNWIPPLGYVGFFDDPSSNLKQFIFPSLALGWALSATKARMIRSTMLEVLREDFITTARAKGLREFVVINRHALKNAMIPVITLFGFNIGLLIGGSVLIEQIFTLPGIGRFLVTGLNSRDFPVIQGVVLLIVVGYAFVNLFVDLLYGLLDPRIRYA